MLKRIKHKSGDKVVINGLTYTYCDFYKRLEIVDDDLPKKKTVAMVACPRCHGITFNIGYGNPGSYECVAHCPCGHDMVVYDG